jgi:hypothetical protein
MVLFERIVLDLDLDLETFGVLRLFGLLDFGLLDKFGMEDRDWAINSLKSFGRCHWDFVDLIRDGVRRDCVVWEICRGNWEGWGDFGFW